jgi:hypothetical protein
MYERKDNAFLLSDFPFRADIYSQSKEQLYFLVNAILFFTSLCLFSAQYGWTPLEWTAHGICRNKNYTQFRSVTMLTRFILQVYERANIFKTSIPHKNSWPYGKYH